MMSESWFPSPVGRKWYENESFIEWVEHSNDKHEKQNLKISTHAFLFFPLAPRQGRWFAQTSGEQDRVWPAGIGLGTEAGLPANKKPDPRRKALQSLHL